MIRNFLCALPIALGIATVGCPLLSAADASLSWKVIPLAVDANEGIDIADFDGDGIVNVNDILQMISQWGGTGRTDINGDSIVNVSDILSLIDAWGNCN